MIFNLQRAVTDFHKKHGFTVDARISSRPVLEGQSTALACMSEDVSKMSKVALSDGLDFEKLGDDTVFRVHLILEEVGELLWALAERDEVKTADALADLQYVVEGTAVSLGIPLTEVLAEVHRSNMTKVLRKKQSTPRMRDKGPEYSPPNIKQALLDGSVRMERERLLESDPELSLEFVSVICGAKDVDPNV